MKKLFPFLLALVLAGLWMPRVARAVPVGTLLSGPTSGDGASVYMNPAAMTLLEGTHVLLFGAVSAIRLSYQPDTPSAFDGQPYPEADTSVPKPGLALGLVTDATLKRFRFGLGVSLPVLDGATWAQSYDGRPASTRYYATNAMLGQIFIEAAVAYRIARFISVGVGLDVVGMLLSHEGMVDFGAKINQMACAVNKTVTCPLDAPLAREDSTYDARALIDGMGWGVGVFAGLLVTPLTWLRLGLGFHSGAGSVTIPVEMSVELPRAVVDYVSQNLPSVKLPELRAEGEVQATSPMSLSAGLSVCPTPRLEIVADLTWSDLSETTVMTADIVRSGTELIGDQVLIKGRSDDFLVGLRGSYQVLQSLALALRLEYQTNTRPERWVTPVSVDFHRISLHLGAAWRAARWLTLVLEYGHYFLFDRVISESYFGPNSQPTTPEEEGLDKPAPTGSYSVQVDRVGLGILINL